MPTPQSPGGDSDAPDGEAGSPVRREQALRDALDRERAAAEELRRISGLKDALLSAVSHELRTPLTVLQGFAELLLNLGDELLPETRDAAIVAIERNARRLNELLASILDLDRLQRDAVVLTVREIALRGAVDEVIQALELTTDQVVVQVGDLRIHADRGKLERILENLVANALKHGDADEPVHIRAWEHGDGVVVEVADRGRGVRPALREAIFQPFDRSGAVDATPGTGIGLSLVRGFVELHGGRVWVEDHGGGGASFRVWLPSPPTGDP